MTRIRKKDGLGPRTVGRMGLYRKVLADLKDRHASTVFSRDLAVLAGVSPSLVRQDLMGIGYRGTPQHGYEVDRLDAALERSLAGRSGRHVILVGVGHLGRAILHYFGQNHPQLSLVAALEIDREQVGRRIENVPVAHPAELEQIVYRQDVRVAILAVPDAEAQQMADRLVAAGIRSILNFTTVRLQVPGGVYAENADLDLALERVAFFGGIRETV